MKYCTHCGNELMDEAVICPKCGCECKERTVKMTYEDNAVLKTIAKIFMILGCVVLSPFVISLAWTVPMTVHYWNACDQKKEVTTSFKVCSLLFVSLIGGILMLLDDNN